MSTVDLTNEDGINMQPVDMDMTCEISPVSTSAQQAEQPVCAEQQTMKVYLRVRPFSKEELSDKEDQDCVVIENSQTVSLNAPKGSATLKSSEKGIGMSIHKFSFSQIFGPEMQQSELFEDTVKSQMSDFLDGKNALIFSYGVTNAGKTYTIQGTPKQPGILPRVLDATFHYIGGRLHEGMYLKPYLRNDARYLDPDQVKQERSAKASIFASVKDECDPHRACVGLESLSCSTTSLSSSSLSYDQTMLASNPSGEDGSQFALWVAFFEIYNECVYDLLQPSLCSKSKKRAALRVCDDGAGNAYVKDLRWINIQTLGEASKLLQFGNKNRSAAATKMNQSSSRSHSIFTMKLLKIDGSSVTRISEFSLCDLAGSERCNKTKTFGERLKEAGNINNSLLILGKCITALRNNQADGIKSSYIPFRESKLTKLFQAVFCGKGRASMIVNINQCASTYDETLHVMKFSAVAKQVVQVIADKPLKSLAPCLVGRDGKPLLRNGVIDSQALECYLSEEELLDEEDEANMSLLSQNEHGNMIDSLRTKLLAERRRNLVQEMEVRKEMGDAMLQQLMESEELRTQQIDQLKESFQEKLENTFEIYKDAIKEHAYQSAMNNLEDDYVPLDEFIAEQEKVEALKRKVSALESSTSTTVGVCAVPTVVQSCQTRASKATEATEATEDHRSKWLYKEKCALESICEDKQQLILSLEKRLKDLSKTMQNVRDGFLEKSADLDVLQDKADAQTKSMEDILRQSVEKDREIASLKAELAKVSQMPPVQPKIKRGLLANIREAVASPRKSSPGRTLRKTIKTTQQ
ncbi:kinesin-like protein KIF20A [Cottoperca gobio]|uniref:Kinesin-like protein n=1 Tax=Cottoperca gobio TaxID=56716 RepID=A0A6J2RUT9_COTGO|nr:kinesin-like protein KIF20A [Cottoperca gobio]